ncbi:MAG: sigma-70 family RNA polymerase sigma factor [Saprospiraceae bacterium]|nr:sigma-70 family RNA polymerase sigma factor [Saprospiraceae bacterium]
MVTSELIEKCKQFDRKAQKELYENYSKQMLGVCRRYVVRVDEAEDVMIEGFYKVFSQLHQFSGVGNFEGWMRKIMVNESLMHLRKEHALKYANELTHNHQQAENYDVVAEINSHEILELLDSLSTGYRTVFNLYIIEGYKHQEIAEMLGISENTSKTQLMMAKEKMKKLILEKQNYYKPYSS